MKAFEVKVYQNESLIEPLSFTADLQHDENQNVVLGTVLDQVIKRYDLVREHGNGKMIKATMPIRLRVLTEDKVYLDTDDLLSKEEAAAFKLGPSNRSKIALAKTLRSKLEK